MSNDQMHCSMCDALLPTDAKYCIVCGAAVTTAQTGHTQRLPPTQDWPINPAMVTSGLTLPGFQIVASYGIVRGLTVRSASIGGQIVAAWKSLGGGNIHTMIEVCERARTEAYLITLQHAAQLGANAIIGFSYDTTEIAQGMTEVLAYGTAVMAEPLSETRG